VMPVQGSKREKQLEIRALLHGIQLAKDIIVSRPEDFDWRKISLVRSNTRLPRRGRCFMPEIEQVITVVGEWVKKAENDSKNAAYTLEMDDECPTDTVCFHAQQVVEKYLKALLAFKGIPFPKSHNISTSSPSCRRAVAPDLLRRIRTSSRSMPRSPGTRATMNRSPWMRRRRLFALPAM
jgi:hypothetical protein